jgi:hypothetical protein
MMMVPVLVGDVDVKGVVENAHHHITSIVPKTKMSVATAGHFEPPIVFWTVMAMHPFVLFRCRCCCCCCWMKGVVVVLFMEFWPWRLLDLLWLPRPVLAVMELECSADMRNNFAISSISQRRYYEREILKRLGRQKQRTEAGIRSNTGINVVRGKMAVLFRALITPAGGGPA